MIKSLHAMVLYYILLLIAHIGLIWFLPYIPTQDGPSHIYNLLILHDLLNGGKEWGEFFVYQLKAVPNFGFTFLAYPLLHFFHPLVVERIFLSFYIVLMGVSVPLFLRTFKKPALPVSYFVFPVIFNYTLLKGFYSYIVAVPLFLLAFSFAWRIRFRSAVYKFIFFNIIGLIIFYFHLIPFIFFLLYLIIATLVESIGYRKKAYNFLKLLLILAPSMFNLFYYLKSGTNNSIPDFSYLLSLSHFVRLITELFFFSSANFLPGQILPASLLMALIVFLLYGTIKDFKSNSQVGNVTNSEKMLISLLLFLVFIYLFAPLNIGDGWYFNHRFPWVILLILLPLLRIPDTIAFKRNISIAIVGIVSMFFVFNAAILWQQSGKVEKFLTGLHVGLPKGTFVMTFKTKFPDPARTTVDILLHAASYYGIFSGCVDIGNYEASTPFFPVRFRKTMPAMPSDFQISYKVNTIRWENYPAIEYLLGLEIDDTEKKALSKYFYVIWEQEEFNIWKRKA